MGYDQHTNTISFIDSADLNRGAGQLFIRTLKALAEMPGPPEFAVKEWNTIKDWLNCPDGNLTDSHLEKIGLAWQSYLARGISPSIKLDQSFKTFAKTAKKENWETISLPYEIEDVFDRMLASDRDIYDKRRFEVHNVTKAMRGLPTTQKPFSFSLKGMSRNSRIIVVLACLWFSYAIFRMSNEYEVFGLYLEEWDEDLFLINAFGPIVGALAIIYIYKWIQKGQ